MTRYRFSDFTLSPRRRVLVRQGREVPLIPRYFDLLVLLVERRHEAVHRRDIFDRVWPDVVVSDSALSQAVRTLRRALGDDSREPRFVRTVARHGYRFVFSDVIEEEDDAAWPEPAYAIDARRWTGAAAGAGSAGVVAGAAGGLLLAAAPESAAPLAIAPVLAVIGGACGALGGAGVGAGLSLGDARAGAHRTLYLIAAAALGGGLVGFIVQWLARWGLAALVGVHLELGGGLEGVVIGGAAGAGYAIATRAAEGQMAAPPEGQRLRAALIIAVVCGAAGLVLTAAAGRPLVGGTIHAIADASAGSRATLAPLGRLIGEPDFGVISRSILGFGEGAMFGLGLAYGLMRRGDISRTSHAMLTEG